MKNMSLLISAFALAACGGPGAKISGKDGAAQALFAASTATKNGAERSNTGIDVNGEVTVNCAEGGTAKLSGFSTKVGLGTGVTLAHEFTITYANCGAAKSDAGVAIYNGNMTVGQNIKASTGSGVTAAQSFKGKVLVQGAFDDFIDADVSQDIEVAKLSSTSGASVSMKLVGTVATSSNVPSGMMPL